jgi:hypothetical protein
MAKGLKIKKSNAKSKPCESGLNPSANGEGIYNKYLMPSSEQGTDINPVLVAADPSAPNLMRVTSTRWVLIRT